MIRVLNEMAVFWGMVWLARLSLNMKFIEMKNFPNYSILMATQAYAYYLVSPCLSKYMTSDLIDLVCLGTRYCLVFYS